MSTQHEAVSGDIAAMAKALAAVSADLGKVHKDERANAGRYSFEYASLPQVLGAILPALQTHGVAMVQRPLTEGEFAGVETVLAGEGWTMTSRMALKVTGQVTREGKEMPIGPQDVGKVVSYCRRFSLLCMFNLAPTKDEDDDGRTHQESASRRQVGRANGNGNGQTVLPSPEQFLEAFGRHGVSADALCAQVGAQAISTAALSLEQAKALYAALKQLESGKTPAEVLNRSALALTPPPQ